MTAQPSWENITTLTEALVLMSGWLDTTSQNVFSAEKSVLDSKEYQVSFLVEEGAKSLDLHGRIAFVLKSDIELKRLNEAARRISWALANADFAMSLDTTSLHAQNAGYIGFKYSWRTIPAVTAQIPLPALCEMVNEWSTEWSLPLCSIAPLLCYYLKGLIRTEEDLYSQICTDLTLLNLQPSGRA